MPCVGELLAALKSLLRVRKVSALESALACAFWILGGDKKLQYIGLPPGVRSSKVSKLDDLICEFCEFPRALTLVVTPTNQNISSLWR